MLLRVVFVLYTVLCLGSFASAKVTELNPVGFVNDYAEMLSEAERGALETKLVQFEKETGNEVVVVTVDTLENDVIENVAVELFEVWGVGKRNSDNGVLLLIAEEERVMRIEVGYGLEPVLTDAQSSWIIRDALAPAFKDGRYAEGVNAAVDIIMSASKREFNVPSDASSVNPVEDVTNMGPFLIPFIAFWAWFLGRTKSFWLGGVVGAGVGVIAGVLFQSLSTALWVGGILSVIGLIFDFVVSRSGGGGGAFCGGFGSGSGRSGGGFGGFGGGRSGGGGATGRW
jgi:uncharacterized protein